MESKFYTYHGKTWFLVEYGKVRYNYFVGRNATTHIFDLSLLDTIREKFWRLEKVKELLKLLRLEKVEEISEVVGIIVRE